MFTSAPQTEQNKVKLRDQWILSITFKWRKLSVNHQEGKSQRLTPTCSNNATQNLQYVPKLSSELSDKQITRFELSHQTDVPAGLISRAAAE